MGFFNSIKNVDELLAKVGYLRQYLRVYDEKDIILFRYNSKGDAKMLSNMYASSVPLPWRGKEYNSVEQMIIGAFIEDNSKPEYKDEVEHVLNMICKCKDGMEVKANKNIQTLYRKVREETIAAIDSWLEKCAFARFAPVNPTKDEQQKMLEDVEKLCEELR